MAKHQNGLHHMHKVLQAVDSAVTLVINSCLQLSGSESTSLILEQGEMPISVSSVSCESSHSMKSNVSNPTLSQVVSSSDILDRSSETPEIKQAADTAPRSPGPSLSPSLCNDHDSDEVNRGNILIVQLWGKSVSVVTGVFPLFFSTARQQGVKHWIVIYSQNSWLTPHPWHQRRQPPTSSQPFSQGSSTCMPIRKPEHPLRWWIGSFQGLGKSSNPASVLHHRHRLTTTSTFSTATCIFNIFKDDLAVWSLHYASFVFPCLSLVVHTCHASEWQISTICHVKSIKSHNHVTSGGFTICAVSCSLFSDRPFELESFRFSARIHL